MPSFNDAGQKKSFQNMEGFPLLFALLIFIVWVLLSSPYAHTQEAPVLSWGMEGNMEESPTVTLSIYGSFSSPWERTFFIQYMPEVKKRYSSENVRVSFYPISRSPAEVRLYGQLLCISAQNKEAAWAMLEEAMRQNIPNQLTAKDLPPSINAEIFHSCLSEEKGKQATREHRRAFRKIPIKYGGGVPIDAIFLVNDETWLINRGYHKTDLPAVVERIGHYLHPVTAEYINKTPVLDIQHGERFIGNENAPIKIIEYSRVYHNHFNDFRGKNGLELRRGLIKEGKALLAHRILFFGDRAEHAARVSWCVPPENYAAFMDEAYFAAEKRMSQPNPLATFEYMAQRHGASRTCFKDEKVTKDIIRIRDNAAKKLQVFRVPTVFVRSEKETRKFVGDHVSGNKMMNYIKKLAAELEKNQNPPE